MKKTFFIQFKCNILEGSAGHIDSPAGVKVFEKVCQLFTGTGAKFSNLDQLSFYGWCATFEFEKHDFFLFIQKYDADFWLLGLEAKSSFFKVFKKSVPDTRSTLNFFSSSLIKSSAFQEVTDAFSSEDVPVTRDLRNYESYYLNSFHEEKEFIDFVLYNFSDWRVEIEHFNLGRLKFIIDESQFANLFIYFDSNGALQLKPSSPEHDSIMSYFQNKKFSEIHILNQEYDVVEPFKSLFIQRLTRKAGLISSDFFN